MAGTFSRTGAVRGRQMRDVDRWRNPFEINRWNRLFPPIDAVFGRNAKRGRRPVKIGGVRRRNDLESCAADQVKVKWHLLKTQLFFNGL